MLYGCHSILPSSLHCNRCSRARSTTSSLALKLSTTSTYYHGFEPYSSLPLLHSSSPSPSSVWPAYCCLPGPAGAEPPSSRPLHQPAERCMPSQQSEGVPNHAEYMHRGSVCRGGGGSSEGFVHSACFCMHPLCTFDLFFTYLPSFRVTML